MAYINIYIYISIPISTSPLKEPFKGNLGLPQVPRSSPAPPGGAAQRLFALGADKAEGLPPGAQGLEELNFLGNPRFPLKCSFKGDIGIDIWLSGLLLIKGFNLSYHNMDI